MFRAPNQSGPYSPSVVTSAISLGSRCSGPNVQKTYYADLHAATFDWQPDLSGDLRSTRLVQSRWRSLSPVQEVHLRRADEASRQSGSAGIVVQLQRLPTWMTRPASSYRNFVGQRRRLGPDRVT
ncbi:hypothetical protein KCP74_03345 [Salmonella enterica subsp. enterica]|nr:hypothetical protein KCP74_03345 [Salmonella enterica subsp. enterica]